MEERKEEQEEFEINDKKDEEIQVQRSSSRKCSFKIPQKLLGLSDSELQEALIAIQTELIENQRGETDQKILQNLSPRHKKIMEMLGIERFQSYDVLEKLLGIPVEEIPQILQEIEMDKRLEDHSTSDGFTEDDYEEFIDDSEYNDTPLEIKHAITTSSKVQQLLGVSPQELKLMEKLGLTHSQLLHAQAASNPQHHNQRHSNFNDNNNIIHSNNNNNNYYNDNDYINDNINFNEIISISPK